jgi:2-polyprenyl-3-methyl-5-hydroxy-6-metoxy-1,4-benzoquinol methylase
MLKNLSTRSYDVEIMDDFENPPNDLNKILNDINRVNYLLGGFSITVKAVQKLVAQHPRTNYIIIDFGCAEGSMLRALAAFFRKQQIKVTFIGIDINENTLQLAQKKSQEFPEISYLKRDIFKADLNELKCDMVISTLTLHHFEDNTIITLLNKFTEMASIGVIINDLQRSAWAYYLFKLFSIIFISTKVAKIDGLISVRRAFKKSELITYSKHVPKVTHDIQWKWAFRYLWVLHKTS